MLTAVRETLADVADQMWRSPQLLATLRQRSEGWQRIIADAAGRSEDEIASLLGEIDIRALIELGEHMPAGPPPSPQEPRYDFGPMTNTCGSCLHGTSTCGSCLHGTGTCGTCVCIEAPQHQA